MKPEELKESNEWISRNISEVTYDSDTKYKIPIKYNDIIKHKITIDRTSQQYINSICFNDITSQYKRNSISKIYNKVLEFNNKNICTFIIDLDDDKLGMSIWDVMQKYAVDVINTEYKDYGRFVDWSDSYISDQLNKGEIDKYELIWQAYNKWVSHFQNQFRSGEGAILLNVLFQKYGMIDVKPYCSRDRWGSTSVDRTKFKYHINNIDSGFEHIVNLSNVFRIVIHDEKKFKSQIETIVKNEAKMTERRAKAKEVSKLFGANLPWIYDTIGSASATVNAMEFSGRQVNGSWLYRSYRLDNFEHRLENVDRNDMRKEFRNIQSYLINLKELKKILEELDQGQLDEIIALADEVLKETQYK